MKTGNDIGSLRDVEAIEAAGLPVLPQSTYEMLGASARLHPDAPALTFFLRTEEHKKAQTWTYQQLFGDITRTANLFHQLGATKDTVIAFMLPNLPETHFVIWGGQAAGIVVAINPLLEPAAIAELLNAAGASILVTLAPFPGADLWPKIQAVQPHVPSIKHLVLVSLADNVHGLRGLEGAVTASVKVHDFGSLMRRQNAASLDSGRRIQSSDYSSFFCTGGTTGAPKIAMRRHGNEVFNAWAVTRCMSGFMGPGKTAFCGLPLFHVNAVLVTGLAPFSQGAHVILGTPQGYRGEGVVQRFWEIVEHHRINFFSGVPTLYASLLQVPVGGRRIDSLEFGLCGAAPMPVQLFEDFQQRTGLKILEGYGLTEATCVSSINPPLGERRVGSVGMRVPGQLMKSVVLDDTGAYVRDCEVDEVGVLVVSGPNVFAGYRLPEQNKGLWVELGDGRRWLNTGDLARQDADGYFWLTGRKKELIIRAGHNIDPAAIEEPLHRHPAVQIAAAIGRPDVHAGELPVAYVQLKSGARATEDELLAFARQQISERAAVPKSIYIVDQIPLTAVGKLFKPALKRQETRHALMAALKEAGVEPRELEVVDNASRGLMVEVRVADARSAELAMQCLGRFPFSFDVSTTV